MASSGAQSATQRGRKYPAIITENFIVLAHVENKSNRKWWKCVHCADDSSFGARIEGRDNNLLNHLANPKRCPNAPGRVQNLARVALAAKGQPKAGVPLPDETSHPTATSESATSPTAEPSQNPSDTSIKRKRANTTSLEQFFDYPLTPEQEKCANIKLFRYVMSTSLHFHLISLMSGIVPSSTLTFPSTWQRTGTLRTSSMICAHHMMFHPHMF